MFLVDIITLIINQLSYIKKIELNGYESWLFQVINVLTPRPRMINF